jgi:hypothetical protein
MTSINGRWCWGQCSHLLGSSDRMMWTVVVSAATNFVEHTLEFSVASFNALYDLFLCNSFILRRWSRVTLRYLKESVLRIVT